IELPNLLRNIRNTNLVTNPPANSIRVQELLNRVGSLPKVSRNRLRQAIHFTINIRGPIDNSIQTVIQLQNLITGTAKNVTSDNQSHRTNSRNHPRNTQPQGNNSRTRLPRRHTQTIQRTSHTTN